MVHLKSSVRHRAGDSPRPGRESSVGQAETQVGPINPSTSGLAVTCFPLRSVLLVHNITNRAAPNKY